MESILRIDMSAAGGPAASRESLGRYAGLEGRALTSLLVAEEVDPGCHPLGGGNRLVVAPGRGTGAGGGTGVVSVGCKSPLTGGIVASRAEGSVADALRALGYGALVVEGQPDGDDVWTIVIDARGVAFAVENRYRMIGNLEATAKLRRAHGSGAALLTIGPAGEMGLGAASVSSSPGGVRPTRHCGLGGAGAVMGSKRVKAIVVGGGAGPAAVLVQGAAPLDDAGAPGRASPYREACGVRDPVVLGQLEALEDDLGLDAMEVAAAVSLCMEAGLARFGDGQATLRLFEEIARGTPLGRILGSGLLATGEALGLERLAPRHRLDGAAWDGSSSLAVAEQELGDAAREIVSAERWFHARARAAAVMAGARDGEPGLRPHPIVFGAIDDDLARLFGAQDLDADPFDPQLQLPIGLHPASPAGACSALSLPSRHPASEKKN
jgi:aldehyde:ferredoxin oxidoreductase